MSADLQISHKLDYSAVQHDSQRDLMMLASLHAPPITTNSDRSPIDLVAVLDRSGSMAGGKLKAVRKTMNFLVQQMSAEDKLSIITFSNEVVVDFPLTYMTADNKLAAQVAISNVHSSGGTNLSGGLFKGIDQHQQQSPPQAAVEQPTEQPDVATGGATQPARSERVRTVFLFTDGQATTGVVNTVQLGGILGMMLQNPIRPTIYTFGFGADYDSETLGAISQAGQGQSSFIEDAESIAPALASALGGLMTISAQNVELTFTPKDGVTISRVETSFRVNAANGAFTVTLGDLYAEEKKDFLVKLKVASVPEPLDNQEIVTLRLRFLDLAEGSMKQKSLTAAISRPAEAPESVQVDPDMQEAIHRVNTANAITAAVRAADEGRVPQARRVISNQLTQLATAPDSELTSALRGDLDQILASYTNHNPSSRNQALSMAVGHSSQRRTLYHSSRPADRAGNQTSTYGPYSTRSQSDYANRSTVLPARDTRVQTAAAGEAPTEADEWAEYNFPTSRRPSYPSAAAGGLQPQGAGLSRATSNVSAAGTEVYDPVLDSDLLGFPQSGSRQATGGAPSSFNFADPTQPVVGTPSLRRLSSRQRATVPGSAAPAVADAAASMPHGSQASHTVRSPTRNSDPLAFLDSVSLNDKS